MLQKAPAAFRLLLQATIFQDMQERSDAAEASVIKGGAKAIQKAEQRLKTLQTDMEAETRRSTEAAKNLARADRRVREFDFQVGEDKKNYDKLSELVEKLTAKLKIQKKQLEDAVCIFSCNQLRDIFRKSRRTPI